MTASSIESMLDGWRERGDDRIDAVRFHYIEALQRRASAFDGEARRMLDGKLAVLVEAYAAAITQADASAREPARTHNAQATLGAVVEALAERTQAHPATPTPDNRPRPAELPRMDALAQARKIWADVRTQSQVRQSREQTTDDAGPLNSSRLVHRALDLMGECSPAYLERFLAYLDALSWLEQMGRHGALAADAPAPVAGQTVRKPRKSRSPRNSANGAG